MKLLYKIIIFLAMFQIVVVAVESTSIYPNSFFEENEIETLEIEEEDDIPNAMNVIFENMFLPSEGIFGEIRYGVAVLVGIFLVAGTAVSFLTKQNPAVIVIAVLGYSFFNMISNSFGFFSNLFRNWNSTALIYLGVAIGVGLVIITIITILETISHGRSGS